MKAKLGLAMMVAAALVACGGGGSDDLAVPQADAIEACRGTQKTAIVALYEGAYPELYEVADNCVYRVSGVEDMRAAMDKARKASGRAHIPVIAVGDGAGVALDFMGTYPGRVDVASLWLVPKVDVSRISNSIAAYKMNGGECYTAQFHAQGAHGGSCLPATEFGPVERAAAIAQLRLDQVK
jgi:alpha-beta hydrolase superfamily lysophospholipase